MDFEDVPVWKFVKYTTHPNVYLKIPELLDTIMASSNSPPNALFGFKPTFINDDDDVEIVNYHIDDQWIQDFIRFIEKHPLNHREFFEWMFQ